jgi:hypothetical protein
LIGLICPNAVIDSVDEALSDQFSWDAYHYDAIPRSEVIQIKYDSVSETAEVAG